MRSQMLNNIQVRFILAESLSHHSQVIPYAVISAFDDCVECRFCFIARRHILFQSRPTSIYSQL